MAYDKPFLVTQDFAVGIQSVNRLNANNEATHALWVAKHGSTDDNVPPLTLQEQAAQFGRHSDILVARSVSHFSVATADDGSVYLEADVSGRMVRSVARVSTGRWRIYLNTSDIYGAVGTGIATGSDDRKVSVLIVGGDPSTNLNGYLDVLTWDVAGGNLEDFDFSLVIWGRVA